MNIPVELKKIVEKNQKFDGIVKHTVSLLDEILSENKLYFFEEYTDHGIKHIESVLTSTVKIIPTQTLDNILNNDYQSVAIYILSILLHDIGMHITPEGFNALISGYNDNIRIKEIDNKTWEELWNDYLDEARRFGDKEKRDIIGNAYWDFKNPDIENKDKLSGEDKKLIDEFIRRHHPRIAHEIALKGIPIKNGHISFASELSIDLRNICGLVARSHGIKIRSLFDYLQLKFQDTWQKPYNIEVIYLMVLIRIADYFQVDSSRTPDVTVKLKSFNSPISQIEHYKHLDVKYVQPFNKDPETLVFQCEPRNVLIYIKLKELFEDIQKELDTCWAIIGEIYGKESTETQPKIVYRRIKSNIDNIEDFSKTVNYIPEKIKFNVSNELPKLLIGPLYGNDPTYGVRELLQNAVDSCREREFLEYAEYTGNVKITIYSVANEYFFKIEDNGLGMSLNVVKNYFLEVGSSLRKSTFWKKSFVDINGKTNIQRSGKFGIGVLASFLLGNNIYVETKDLTSSFGLCFDTNLDTEHIEIKKLHKESVGTKIIIKINKDIIEKLKNSNFPFDKWYVQNNPKVEIIDLTRYNSDLGVKEKSPGINEKLDFKWRELKIDEYKKIIWTYEHPFWHAHNGKVPSLIVNGIVIPEFRSFRQGRLKSINVPYISVFDFNGKIPLKLNRNNLDQGLLPFENELLIDIYKDFIAKLLCEEYKFDKINGKLFKNKFYHPSTGIIDLIFSKDGFILNNKFFKHNNGNRTLLELHLNSDFNLKSPIDIKDSFICTNNLNKDYVMTDYMEKVNLRNYSGGAKLFIGNEMYSKVFDNNFNRYPLGVRRDHTILNTNEKYTEIQYRYSESDFSINELNEILNHCNCIIETKLYSYENFVNIFYSIELNELLEDYLSNDCVIPYEISERKKKFPKAFDELAIFIDKYTST